ncbi:prolipoprotein diacylglyceryl transferase [Candidatus Woesearchaeota archaeon]|nr:prolipoprotein diacylglyceryl transferase [Candidatus Woesearchaeota archaeon]
MSFTHNIDPILFSIPIGRLLGNDVSLDIYYYGIIYLLGFIVAYFVLDQYRKAGKIQASRDVLEAYIFWMMVGVIIGARIIHVLFWHPSYYFADPIKILYLWQGGLAFHGGLLGAIIVTIIYAKKMNLSVMQLADIIVLPTTLMLAFGRIANFINAELWGTKTSVPWCVEFPRADGCRHPSQIYGAISRFIIFGLLYLLSKKEHKDGFLFWNFVFWMGLARFIVDFFREDPRLLLLTAGQWLSTIMIALGAFILFKEHLSTSKTVKKTHKQF